MTEVQKILIKKIKTAFQYNDKEDFTHNLIYLLFVETEFNERQYIAEEIYKMLKGD